MSRLLELSTGCRLHFGLLELAEGAPNRYGGLGLMLESPHIRLRWHWANEALGTNLPPNVEVQRRVQLAQTHAWSVLTKLADAMPAALPPATIEVLECPPLHSGLGVGTQLATAVAQLSAVAYRTLLDGNPDLHLQDAARLAAVSGRGKRSAIGLHGFLRGGLIRDLGYDQSPDIHAENVGRPVHTHSVTLPTEWMVVLCCSATSGDVHGPLEEQLMSRAGLQANPLRERMLQLSEQALLAAQSQDFVGFTAVLDEYMDLASRLFVGVQGGSYRDARVAQRVAGLQRVGLSGVGQSSWGPTVFGFAPSPERAQWAADQLLQTLQDSTVKILVSRPKATGAQWSLTSAGGKHYAG